MYIQPLIADTIGDTVEQEIEDVAVTIIESVSSLTVALILVVLGFFIGGKLKPTAVDVAEYITESGIGVVFRNREERVSEAFGKSVKYYIVLFAVYLAADRIGYGELAVWLEDLVLYLPHLFAGIVVISLGIGAGHYGADKVRNGELAKETGYEDWIAMSTKAVVYSVSVVIGLATVGINMTFANSLAGGFSGAVGVGITAAIAIVVGFAAGVYLKENDVFDEED